MKLLTLQAPAKLNLSLRILNKRADGFHEIDTLMVKLSGLADVIEFHEADHFSLSCDDPSIPCDERNLVIKAKILYESIVCVDKKIKIILRKNIPHGAGLGGGSSDAAATLLGLNQLSGTKINDEQLIEMAASLGSDIPFFMNAGAARCSGRGEIIHSIPAGPALPVLLLKPSFSVETPDAYRRWERSIEIKSVNYKAQELEGLLLANDLERPVFEKHRFLAEVKQWLLSRDETAAALMSGSGSTVFAILHDIHDAAALVKAARDELDPHFWCWSGTTED